MSEVTWGLTWHGEYANELSGPQLTTPDAHVLTSANGILALPSFPGSTRYIKRPGLPAPVSPAAVTSVGGAYRNDMVLFGTTRRVSPKSTYGFGADRWIYFDSTGQAWKMFVTSTTATIAGTPSTPSPTPLTGTMTVSVWCAGKAGVLTPGWSAPAPTLVDSFAVTVRGWNRGAVWEPGTAQGRPNDIEQRPDGAKALYVVEATGYSQTYAVQSTLIEISLTGDGTDEVGTGISASGAVVWNRDAVTTYYSTETAVHGKTYWSLTGITITATGPSEWDVTRTFAAVYLSASSPPLRYFQLAYITDVAEFGYSNDGSLSITEFRVEEYWNDTGRYEPIGSAISGTRISHYTGNPAPSGTIGELWTDEDVHTAFSSPGMFLDDPLSWTQDGIPQFNANSIRQTTYELYRGGGVVDSVVEQRNISGTLASPISTGFHGEWALAIKYSNNVVGLLEFNADGAYYGFTQRVRGRYGPDGSGDSTMYPGMTLESILPAQEALYLGRTVPLSSTAAICASWSPRDGTTKTWLAGAVGTYV